MAHRKRKLKHNRPKTSTKPPKSIADKIVSLCNKAEACFKLNDDTQALTWVNQAIQLVSPYKDANPKDVFFLAARCYHRLGKIEQAIEAIEKEIAINPEYQHAKVFRDFLNGPEVNSKNINLSYDGLEEPAAYPSVSLCMIVKNEEKYLAGCLESVGDFADEIIIVDTGSTDRTVDIAKSFGARVAYFDWIDNFSAARNESLKDAMGDWIFWMDADDRISHENLVRLKQAIVSGQADAYFCKVISNVKERGEAITETVHLRLFRNKIGLYFENPIHEDVTPVAMRQGLTIARTNIHIEHIGYTGGLDVLKNKARRNLKIIRETLADDPNNIYWQYHLGVNLYLLGDLNACLEYFEKVIANPSPKLQQDREIYQAYASLTVAYNNLGNVKKASYWLKEALQIFPNRKHLQIAAGIFHLTHGEAERAIGYFERAKIFPLDEVGLSFSPGVLEMRLSQTYLLLNQPDLAKEAYISRLSQLEQPQMLLPEDVHHKAKNLFNANQDEELLALLQPYAQTDTTTLRLLAQVYERNKRWEEARKTLENAIILSGVSQGEWARLAEFTFKSGNEKVAKCYCGLALADDEHDIAAQNILGILAFKQDDFTGAIRYFIQVILIDANYEPAINNLEQVAGLMKTSTIMLIRQYGQQLMSQTEYNRAAEVFIANLKLFPNDAESYKLLAVTLQKLGREDDALVMWRQSVELENALN